MARVDNGGGSSLRSASSRRSGFGISSPAYISDNLYRPLRTFPSVWIVDHLLFHAREISSRLDRVNLRGRLLQLFRYIRIYIYIHIVILNFFLLSSLFLHPFFFNAVELFPRFPALHDLCDVPVGKDSFVEKNVTTRCTTSGNVMLIDFCCVKSEHEYGKCRGRKREGTNVDRSVSIAQVLSRVVNTCSDIGPISRTYLLIFRYA